MGTFHYLPNSHEVNIQFRAMNIHSPKIEAMANQLKKSFMKYTNDMKSIHMNEKEKSMIIYEKYDSDEHIPDELADQKTKPMVDVGSAISDIIQAMNDAAGCEAYPSLRVPTSNTGCILTPCFERFGNVNQKVHFYDEGSRNDRIISLGIECNNLYMRIYHDRFAYELNKCIYVVCGDYAFDNGIHEFCCRAACENNLRTAGISESSILSEVINELHGGGLKLDKNEAFDKIYDIAKDMNAYLGRIRTMIDMYLYDTKTSALFIHCIKESTMSSMIDIAKDRLKSYCENSGKQEYCESDVMKIVYKTAAPNDVWRSSKLSDTCGYALVKGDDWYKYLYTEVDNNRLVKKIKKDIEHFGNDDAEIYNLVHEMKTEIMGAYDLYSRGDFYNELDSILRSHIRKCIM